MGKIVRWRGVDVTEISLKAIAATLAGVGCYVFGKWDNLLLSLIIMMLADYLSGVACSAIHKTTSSNVGYIGLLRKGGILLVVLVAHQLDNVMVGIVPDGPSGWIRNIVILGWIGNEGISILENWTKAGLPMFPGLKSILIQLRDRSQTKLQEHAKAVKPPEKVEGDESE